MGSSSLLYLASRLKELRGLRGIGRELIHAGDVYCLADVAGPVVEIVIAFV